MNTDTISIDNTQKSELYTQLPYVYTQIVV